MKKIVAACIDQILEFDTQSEAANYVEDLRKKNLKFRILHREEINGKHRVRIQQQYNNVPLIEG